MMKPEPMTEEVVAAVLLEAGAQVRSRSGRSDSYGAPRDFSFEVKGAFPNGFVLQVVARQFNYRDPWEAAGRVNDMVDLILWREGACTPLPKGFPFFQERETEEGVDLAALREIVACVVRVNAKIYLLQQLTGDVP